MDICDAQSFIDCLDDSFIVVDQDFRIVQANAVALRAHNLTQDQVLNRPCYVVLHDRTAPCDESQGGCAVRKVRVTGQRASVTHYHLDSTSTKHIMEITASALPGADAQTALVVEMMRDVTERVRLETETTQRHSEVVALNQITSTVARVLDLETLAGEVLEAMLTAFHIAGGAIYQVGAEDCVPIEITRRDIQLPLAAVKLLADRVVELGASLTVNDMQADSSLSAVIAKRPAARALVCAPLGTGPANWRGILILGETRPHEWTEAQVRAITTAAQHIAIGLERAHLYREAQERAQSLTEANTRLRALQQISTTLSANLQLDDVLQTVLTSCVKQIGFPFSILLLRDEEQQALRIHAKSSDVGGIHRLDLSSHWPPREIVPLSETHFLPIQVLLTGQPQVCQDLHDLMGRWVNRLVCAIIQQKAHIKQFALIPLRASDETIGVLVVAAPRRLITADDLESLMPFACQAAIAIENAHLFEVAQNNEQARRQALQRAMSVQEEERKRISRELHDETQQALAGLIIGLDTVVRLLDQDPPAARKQIVRLKQAAGSIIDDISGIIRALRPIMLDDLGLLSALRVYAEERLTPLGVQWQIEADSECVCPAPLETVLFRAIQEAISNIAEHAHARQVTIRLAHQPDGIWVQVSDDGVGFDAGKKLRSSPGHLALGLIGMQERLAMVGGRLDILSLPGNGTDLRMWLPV